MARSGLNKTERELYQMWSFIRKVCFGKGVLFEGVPCVKEWETFDGFKKANYFRYLRAKVKWKGYKRVSGQRNAATPEPLKLNNVTLKRKVKELGYSLENTVFTSLSDRCKYIDANHKYMFEGQLLGTRDIKNILKKRGIIISMEQITKRLNNGMDLFAPGERFKIKWKGEYRSYVDIAEMEKVSYEMLKRRNYEVNDIRKALDYCREWDGFPQYEFEGQQLRKMEICKILSDRTGITKGTMNGRFTKFGMNLTMLNLPLGVKITLRKTVYAFKDGIERKFDCIADAARELELSSGNISEAASGKQVHTGGYKFRFEGGQYNSSPIQSMEEQMADARKIMMHRSMQRHVSETRYCEVCEQTKDKKHFNETNFRRCKECMAREKGIVNIGQHQERKEKFEQGLIWCSDCKAYKPFEDFNKGTYHTGFSTICRQHSKERAMLKKYGTKEIYEGQKTLNLLKEKIRDGVRLGTET